MPASRLGETNFSQLTFDDPEYVSVGLPSALITYTNGTPTWAVAEIGLVITGAGDPTCSVKTAVPTPPSFAAPMVIL